MKHLYICNTPYAFKIIYRSNFRGPLYTFGPCKLVAYPLSTHFYAPGKHTHSLKHLFLEHSRWELHQSYHNPTCTAAVYTERDRHRKTSVRLDLTDDRSVVELLASPRRAQKRTATETGGQHRQHRWSRPTHPKHRQDYKHVTAGCRWKIKIRAGLSIKTTAGR